MFFPYFSVNICVQFSIKVRKPKFAEKLGNNIENQVKLEKCHDY